MIRRGRLTINAICQTLQVPSAPQNIASKLAPAPQDVTWSRQWLYMKITVFRDVTPCSRAEIYRNVVFQNFRTEEQDDTGSCFLPVRPVNFWQNARCDVLEVCIFLPHVCQLTFMHKAVTMSTIVRKWEVGNNVRKWIVYGSSVTWKAFFFYVVLVYLNLRLHNKNQVSFH